MGTTGYRAWCSRHGEPILLALAAHELAAGAAFTVAGLPGVGSFLWAVGAGLTLSYLIVNVALNVRARWQPRQFVLTTVLLVAAVAAAVGGVYGVANLLGTLAMVVLMFPPHRLGPERPRVMSLGHTTNARSGHDQQHGPV